MTEALRRRQVPLLLPTPHPGQVEVLANPARFFVLNCGRRWGKSSLALIRLVRAAEAKQGVYWWVWPTSPMGRVGWEMLHSAAGGRAQLNETRCAATLSNGSTITVKSADNEDGLRAQGLDGLVMDECRDIDRRAWFEVLRPALMDKLGWALFVSTPRGTDWFRELYGYADGHPGWARTTHSAGDNPYLPPGELAEARAHMPERLYRQEILAEFIENAGAVFRNLDATCVLQNRDRPEQHKGHTIYAGVDWGKSNDFTVLTLGCQQCHRAVDWDRMNIVEYALQRARIKQLADKWGLSLALVESNSIGEPNLEMLGRDGLPVQGFATTAVSKPPLIEGLVLALERGELQLPEEYKGELSSYEMKVSPNTHRPTYGAASGFNDDRVMSAALLWRLMSEPAVMATQNPFYND